MDGWTEERQRLERQAAAALELRARQQERMLLESTVFGIFEPGDDAPRHLYSVQRQPNGDWEKVDKPYSITLPAILERVLYAKQRFIVLYGGRGGAKSQSVADILIARAKDQSSKIMCLREFQNSIEDSVHSLLRHEIDTHGFSNYFNVTKTSISAGDNESFKFKGISRDPNAVKSAHGFSISWVEEAHSLSDDSLRLLTPTIREAHSQLIFTMNPGSRADPMSQRFLVPFETELNRCGIYEDDIHLIIRTNFSDNPWHDTLEAERIWDQLHRSPAEYRHIWLGDYMDEIPGSIIPVEWFEAAIDAHERLNIKVTGARVVSHDPSDEGTDAKGLCVLHGILVKDVLEGLDNNGIAMDVNAGMDWALDRVDKEQADHFVWDVDGLGSGLRRQVQQALDGTKTEYTEFRGGGKIVDPEGYIDPEAPGGRTNQDAYPNRRSQEYFRLARRFQNTWRAVVKKEYVNPDEIISISSKIKDIDKLRSELCRIPRRMNNRMLLQVMPKPEMKRLYKLESPNMADSVMMATSAAYDVKQSSHWGSLPQQDYRWVV